MIVWIVANYTNRLLLLFRALLPGWASDLKTTSEDMIRKRVIRTGDDTHPYAIEAKKHDLLSQLTNNNEEKLRDLDHFWGWDDPDMIAEDRDVVILHRQYE